VAGRCSALCSAVGYQRAERYGTVFVLETSLTRVLETCLTQLWLNLCPPDVT